MTREKTDDEDSSEERTFLCHTRRTERSMPDEVDKESADALTRNTCVYWRSSPPNSRELPRGCALIRQVGRLPRPGTRRGRRHRPHTLLLYDQLFLGRENERGGLVDSGIMFLDPRFSGTGTRGIPRALRCLKGFWKQLLENRERHTLHACAMK